MVLPGVVDEHGEPTTILYDTVRPYQVVTKGEAPS